MAYEISDMKNPAYIDTLEVWSDVLSYQLGVGVSPALSEYLYYQVRIVDNREF